MVSGILAYQMASKKRFVLLGNFEKPKAKSPDEESHEELLVVVVVAERDRPTGILPVFWAEIDDDCTSTSSIVNNKERMQAGQAIA